MSQQNDNIEEELKRLAAEADADDTSTSQTPPSDQTEVQTATTSTQQSVPTSRTDNPAEAFALSQISRQLSESVSTQLLASSDGSKEAKDAIDDMVKQLKQNVQGMDLANANQFITDEGIEQLVEVGLGKLARKNLLKRAEAPIHSQTSTSTAGGGNSIAKLAAKYSKTPQQIARAVGRLEELLGKKLTMEQLEDAVKQL